MSDSLRRWAPWVIGMAFSIQACGRERFDLLASQNEGVVAGSSTPEPLPQAADDAGESPEPPPQEAHDGGEPPATASFDSSTPTPTTTHTEPTPSPSPPPSDGGVTIDDVLAQPFSAPIPIAGLSDGDSEEDDPSLTADRLALFFNSERTTGEGRGDIWVTTRSAVDSPWGEPQLVSISTNADETTPSISSDGLELWFSREGGCQGNSHGILRTSRDTREAAWRQAECVSVVTSPEDDLSPNVDESRTLLVLGSRRAGTFGLEDLYWSVRGSPEAAWSRPVQIPNVNTNEIDSEGKFALDSRILVFASTRGGGRDLYYSVRQAAAEIFAEPVALAEVNSPQADSDPWVSQDFQHLVFASERDGRRRLYESSR